ncbi:cupin domain-containing protein [Marinobacterium jannaschii]|uniref:cupin domain-containing protein n=1 Tax=Marinobacterium jannaschii TaxID=64970 RepID=UPI000688EB27|nr:cupin domain-containing protein [Marinobacterium jannaschii]
MTAINGDLSKRVQLDASSMDWQPSPSGTVWRKRFHLVGEGESGQVTSLVRYDPGARFPSHPHPGGEEILVLEGIFSDQQGDWPAGSYLLNPEGFEHAPGSAEGCLLLVKLRQFAGQERRHLALDTAELAWQPSEIKGVLVKQLYADNDYPEQMRLEHWAPDSHCGELEYPEGAEFFVISGEFEDEQGRYPAGSWLRLPAGSRHNPRSALGCELYIKTGHLLQLLDAAKPETQA